MLSVSITDAYRQTIGNSEHYHLVLPASSKKVSALPSKSIKENILKKTKRLSLQRIASPKNPITWAAGGALLILKISNELLLPLIQRDATARTNPGKLSVASGHADNWQELLHPQGLIRETFEEVLMQDSYGSLIIPGMTKIMDLPVARIVKKAFRERSLSYKKESWHIPVQLLRKFAIDSITLWNEQGRILSKSAGLILLDRKLRSLNFLLPLQMHIPFTLKNLRLTDGECVMKNKEQMPLNRKMYLLPLETLKGNSRSGYLLQDEWKKILIRKSFYSPNLRRVSEKVRYFK